MATVSRPAQASLQDLGKMVDKAVAIAAKRHQLKVSEKNVIVNWQIIGRVVDDAALAPKFATDVRRELGRNGIKVTSIAVLLDRFVLAGFIERPPVLRDF